MGLLVLGWSFFQKDEQSWCVLILEKVKSPNLFKMMIDVKNVGFTEVRNSNAEFRINVAMFFY